MAISKSDGWWPSSVEKITQHKSNLHRLSWTLSECLTNSVVVHNVPWPKVTKKWDLWYGVYPFFIVLVGHSCMSMTHTCTQPITRVYMHEYDLCTCPSPLPRTIVNGSPGGGHLHKSCGNRPWLDENGSQVWWACEPLLSYWGEVDVAQNTTTHIMYPEISRNSIVNSIINF